MPSTFLRFIAASCAGACAAVIGTSGASAGPMTYAGTLGKSRIVVEFTEDPANPEQPVAGRYFYRAKGVDIPLQAAAHGGMRFAEEDVCTEATCPDDGPAPIAAIWRLTTGNGGSTLEGTWKGAKTLPISLRRIGERTAAADDPLTPLGLFQFSERFWYNDETIDPAVSPYDALKLDGPLTQGPVTSSAGAAYRDVVDPRTAFAYPRIVTLGAGRAADAANDVLQQRHGRFSIAALGCYSLQYKGFNDNGSWRAGTGGTLGGFEEQSTVVTYLSPRVMSWRESSSIWCGGAHPNYTTASITMDLKAGRIMATGDLFKGWTGDAPDDILAFVRARRQGTTGDPDSGYASEAEFEKECRLDEMMASSMAARFAKGGSGTRVIFALERMPDTMNPCHLDLLDVAIADVRPFLTVEAIALFPELK